jgi:hypothetical protein
MVSLKLTSLGLGESMKLNFNDGLILSKYRISEESVKLLLRIPRNKFWGKLTELLILL